MMFRILRLVLIAGLLDLVFSRIGCRGFSGSAVDWFVVYKLPSSKETNNGKKFLYFDEKSSNWTEGKSMDNSRTAVGATLSQFYSTDRSEFRFLYSDDSPVAPSEGYRGHSKGVLLFDSVTGFWMSHSAPNFPPIGSYSFPSTAAKYGQTFICVTLSSESLNDVGEHLRYLQATPYEFNLPENFSKRYPVLQNIVRKQSLRTSDTKYTWIRQISTLGGTPLKTFSKHKKAHNDLWHDVVASDTGKAIAVHSWLNGGADDLHSTCSGVAAYDITKIRLGNVTFNSSKDHSKWAVSRTSDGTLVCIGDMNRQKSQLRRGGGAICLQHRKLWKVFHDAVVDVEPCRGNNVSWNYVLVLCCVALWWNE